LAIFGQALLLYKKLEVLKEAGVSVAKNY